VIVVCACKNASESIYLKDPIELDRIAHYLSDCRRHILCATSVEGEPVASCDSSTHCMDTERAWSTHETI